MYVNIPVPWILWDKWLEKETVFSLPWNPGFPSTVLLESSKMTEDFERNRRPVECQRNYCTGFLEEYLRFIDDTSQY